MYIPNLLESIHVLATGIQDFDPREVNDFNRYLLSPHEHINGYHPKELAEKIISLVEDLRFVTETQEFKDLQDILFGKEYLRQSPTATYNAMAPILQQYRKDNTEQEKILRETLDWLDLLVSA